MIEDKPFLIFGTEIAEHNLTNRINVLILIFRFQNMLKRLWWNSMVNGTRNYQ